MTENLRYARLVAFDVDGVFTDGRFYLADDGTETKAFFTQDGFGVRCLLEAGIHVAVVSGRTSTAVALRMRELGVKHVIQGSTDKVSDFEELLSALGISKAHSVFVGDDIPDLPLLKIVGTPIAVANAVQQVKDACELITLARGGFGAVREVCELVLAAAPE